jgi:hypothetical protein
MGSEYATAIDEYQPYTLQSDALWALQGAGYITA